jgi:putative oxidoreductase
MKQVFPTRFAEIIYALVMAIFGLLHFKTGASATVPLMPGPASMWMYITGAAFVAAALAIIINKYKRLACYLLALMLIIFILVVHLKPFLDNPYNVHQPLKDLALAMGAILIGNNASK